MYARVLAAINGHMNSEIAARYAKQLAKAAGAHLLLCVIEEPGHREKEYALAREAANRVQHAALELGIRTETLVDRGDPVRKIRDIIVTQAIDILFVSTRHEDIKHRFYAGPTIARRLLRTARCSVALVRVVHLGRIQPREILAPLKAHIDRIPERAYFTSMLAKAFDSTVHFFHAAAPARGFFRSELHIDPLGRERRLPTDIGRFTSHMNEYGVPYEHRLALGFAGKGIAIEAAARRRDLIIMGASVRGVLDYLLRGSPVEYLLRETPCNLIVFRPGK